ncbi:MAG: GTP cyclohydrolase II [Campylobacterota bacterium]|nr:GTP cyclohydrolase II [Campylobacterota bacterium]
MNIKISQIANLPTTHGDFLIQSFKEHSKEHLVIFSKNLDASTNVNVRIHSECLTGDAIGSIKCDCQAQLNFALDYVNEHTGMVIYLRQEGRNIGLLNKVNAYALQDKGLDTVAANHQLGFSADERSYEIVETILNHFKIKKINLLTNNPEKMDSLKNIAIENRIPIEVGQNPKNSEYLRIKKEKMGHLFE